MKIYASLLDVPLDPPGVDGDDSLVPTGEVPFTAIPPPPTRALTAMTQAIAVPFFPFKDGDEGAHIVAWRRAMSRAGYLVWEGFDFNPKFGVYGVRTMKKFQKRVGIPQTGRYDAATHRKLARHYDAYGIRLLLDKRKREQVPEVTPEQKKRNAFLAELMYLYNRRWGMVYTQNRPWDLSKPPYGLDCSASGEWASRYSGLRSPSGYSGWGYGNTDSQIARFRALNRRRSSYSNCEIGDFVFYGRGGDPSHVAYWIGGGRVWSFGSYPAKILNYNYRSDLIGAYDLVG